jgi:hypothetical protein
LGAVLKWHSAKIMVVNVKKYQGIEIMPIKVPHSKHQASPAVNNALQSDSENCHAFCSKKPASLLRS